MSSLERTLHRDFYLSDAAFSLERERLFWREWFCVGREEELSAPGQYAAALHSPRAKWNTSLVSSSRQPPPDHLNHLSHRLT